MNPRTALQALSALALAATMAFLPQRLQAQAYALDLLGTSPQIPTIPLFDRGGSVRYLPSSVVGVAGTEKLLQLRLNDALLCGDFSTEAAVGNPNPLRLRLLDVNNRVLQNAVRPGTNFALDSFGPLASGGSPAAVVYKRKLATPNTRGLQITIDESRLVCRHLRTQFLNGGYTLAKQFDAAGTDFIFADRFEAIPVTPPPTGNCSTNGTGSDLAVNIELPPGTTGVRGTQPLSYLIRVSNNGLQAVSGIQLRDFVYGTAAVQPNAGVFQFTGNNVWNCANGNCGTPPADRSGNVYLPSFALNPGENALVQVTRPWVTANGGVDLDNVPFGIAAAVFSSNESLAARDPNRCNDVAVFNRTIRNNLPPTLGGLPASPPAVLEDSGNVNFIFSISDDDGTPASQLTTTVITSPSGIVNASITGTGATRTLSVVPIANAFGPVLVQVTARDPEQDSTTALLAYNVSAVNDQPSYAFNVPSSSSCPGVFTPEVGATPATLTFQTAPSKLVECSTTLEVNFGPNESAQQIVEIVERNIATNGVIAFPSTAITPDGKNVRIIFGVSGQSGIATFRFKIRDNGGLSNGGVDLSTEKILRVRVPSLLPTITQLGAQVTNEDVAVVRNLTISDADNNPADFVPVVTSSNSSLIAPSDVTFGAPVIVNANQVTRDVTMTPKTDQFGSATIRISVSDGDGTAFTEFTLTVASVNDAPRFTSGGVINFPSNAGLSQQILYATQIGRGPIPGVTNEDGQLLTWTVLNHTPNQGNILDASPSISFDAKDATRATISIDLRNGGGGLPAEGYACFRVRLRDNGPSAPAPNNNTTIRTLKIVVGADTYPACDPAS